MPERIKALGPLSIGHPHAGYLLNAARMPKGDAWRITVPSHGYATQETIDGLTHCAQSLRAQFPGADPVNLGSLSAERGGHLPPHKSHRTGRDVDVYFPRKPGTERWLRAATRDDIDLPKTWALLKCFILETDTDMILIDRVPKAWLRHYARAIGEPEEWLTDVFDDKKGTKSALIRPIPGHVAHMHVRFVSPHARRLANRHYDELVKLNLVNPARAATSHTVQRGDTLSGLTLKYRLKVAEIQKLNDLRSTTIRLGQKLIVETRVDVRGVREAVWVPPRRRHPTPGPSQVADARTTVPPSFPDAQPGAQTKEPDPSLPNAAPLGTASRALPSIAADPVTDESQKWPVPPGPKPMAVMPADW